MRPSRLRNEEASVARSSPSRDSLEPHLGGGFDQTVASLVMADQPVDFPLLAGLSDADAARVVAAGRRYFVGNGQHVFRQGEPHRGVYVIRSGKVRTYYAGPNGREITLAHWKEGNFVGGPELFGAGEHVWSGVAIGGVEILAISGPALRQLAESMPKLAVNLLDGLVAKGKCYSFTVQMLGTRSMVQRVAYLLLILAEYDFAGETSGPLHIQRPLTHDTMAGLVGANRQWVSSAMRRFQKDGLLRMDDARRIHLIRPQELVRIASG